MGPVISGDEQDQHFSGRCSFKQRITFKAEGDGFLNYAICEDGYTYSWLWRFLDYPELKPKLSPLHNRMLRLFTRLRVDENGVMQETGHDNTQCYMDNLYHSLDFAYACMRPDVDDNDVTKWPVVRVAGPIRSNRSVPPSIFQKEVTAKDALVAARGTV